MKRKYRFNKRNTIYYGSFALIFSLQMGGQTLVNLGTQGRNVDFSNAAETRPTQVGTNLPSTCATGDLYFLTSGAAGQNLYGCSSPNLWSLVGQNTSSLMDPGANGIVKRTAANTTTVVSAPSGALVGTTDPQTLTNKSIDASEITSGTISGARLPAFSGDVAVSAGTTATSLSVVNNTPGSFGDATHAVQITVDAKGRITAINQASIAVTNPAPSFYQQISSVGTSLTQRPVMNLSNAFIVRDNAAASRTDVDLATVNSTPGTFGSATQVPVITVNAYGQITAISSVSAASNSNSGNTSTSSPVNNGTLLAMPSTCSAGSLYVATDQPIGQQIYTCSSSNVWSQFISVGGSGALALNNGSLDIVTSVVPRLAAANNFSGLNTFSSGIRLASSGAQPTCNTTVRGLLWFSNNGSSKDGVQACVYDGSNYNWISLY